jgi:DNA-binding transcriptional LysR family regulator
VALSALDSDVIKSYVSLGLGVGLISQRAFRAGKEEGLVAIECDHLFPAQTTRLAYRRGAYLRGYVVEFIRLFAPNIRGEDLKQLQGPAGDNFAI